MSQNKVEEMAGLTGSSGSYWASAELPQTPCHSHSGGWGWRQRQYWRWRWINWRRQIFIPHHKRLVVHEVWRISQRVEMGVRALGFGGQWRVVWLFVRLFLIVSIVKSQISCPFMSDIVLFTCVTVRLDMQPAKLVPTWGRSGIPW